MEYLSTALHFIDVLIVPVLVMVMNVQGRISRMEGEVSSLFAIVKLLSDKRGDD